MNADQILKRKNLIRSLAIAARLKNSKLIIPRAMMKSLKETRLSEIEIIPDEISGYALAVILQKHFDIVCSR